MRVIRVLTMAAIVAGFGLEFAEAQPTSGLPVPAEFPPASYSGRQYVDSNGCVFLRAGVSGNTTWIPRVTRQRKMICGAKPSLAKTRTAQAPAAAPAKTRTAAKAPAKAAPQPKAKPQPQPQKVRQVAKQAPPKVVRAPAVAAPVSAPPVGVVTAPAPASSARTVTAPARPVAVKTAKAPARIIRSAPAEAVSACPGLSPVSQRYMGGEDVRCGPQGGPHVTYITGGGGSGAEMHYVRVAPVQAASKASRPAKTPLAGTALLAQPVQHKVRRAPQAAANVRVVPRHVYAQQQKSNGISVSEGYKRVWDDDRLNPYRAHQTFEGKAQMEVMWSSTVPRYLIDTATNRDVTYKYPGLRYPYTSFAQQRAAGVAVQTAGRVVADPIPVRQVATKTAPRAAPESDPVRVVRRQVAKPVLSTRSQAPAAAPKAPASHRFVQAGMFSQKGNAMRVAQRLSRSGLPARLSTFRRGGKTYTRVLAGPFANQPDLHAALRTVRGAGFSDAFLLR
ncbi:SPOR domain-containing protein [Roseovarius salincola]|uniref:SPOR domain-containing protein n=1 Tax=Roseovarius salincola TaxID=2978479 RepID=UPI0022A843A7|nr:SPOR domain-containing protein [Roseovarius sp. EGI FJ00037]